MIGDMQFKQAPKENLQTWEKVTKMFFWGSIGVAVLLAVMAATLT
jgi:hypothetical protein